MRYRVYDLPINGHGAFTPTLNLKAESSSWGLVKRTGAPGTMPIPAPSPTRLWAPPISAQAETQSSNCSPDVRLPDIYIAYADNMGPSVHVNMAARRQTPIPIPAVSWINTALTAMQGVKVGGRIAQAWPRAFQRFPTITGRNG
jgi:hypothetical protein